MYGNLLRPSDPTLHVISKPGGGINLPRLLLVKMVHTSKKIIDGLLG